MATKIKEIHPTGGTWVWNSVLHACLASWNRGQCRLFPWEQFAGGTIHVVHHGHNILLFFVFFSLTFFFYCCISEYFFLWLSISFKSGCQRICRAIHRHCQVCCVNCNSLICPTFLFQTKFLFVQCCSAYIPACPEAFWTGWRLFLSLSDVCLRDRFSFVVRALDCRAGDPEFDIPRCDLNSFFRLLSFPCSLK